MHILSLLRDASHIAHLNAALCLAAVPCLLREASMSEISQRNDDIHFDLALVSAEIEEGVALVSLLRQKQPSSKIMVLGEIRALEPSGSSPWFAAGADVVIDARYSPYETALMPKQIKETVIAAQLAANESASRHAVF